QAPVTPAVGTVKVKVKVLRKKAIVRWTRAANATGYAVRIRRPGRTYTAWRAVEVRRFTVRKLRAGKKYGVKVRGIGDAGKGPVTTVRFRAKKRPSR
ncbi:MAG: hypothetical protein KDC40_16030, partial [Actinobacteria bacterium]|nr:hypothetical protein [Actinomycetota bacterium]